MTHDDIVRIAREAGWTQEYLEFGDVRLERFARLVASAALSEQDAEPKCGAIIEVFDHTWQLHYMALPVGKHKLYTQQYTYTAPPRREWQSLTDDEIDARIDAHIETLFMQGRQGWAAHRSFARAVEAALRAKNGGGK